MNKAEATQTAKAAAGKAAGVMYDTKNWLARQFKKPTVTMVVGMALGAAAEYGVRKGMQNYRITHKRTSAMQ